MAAPTGFFEKRDALAPCLILARLLARREVRDVSRRLGVVDLTSTRVTLHVGADLCPGAFRGCASGR